MRREEAGLANSILMMLLLLSTGCSGITGQCGPRFRNPEARGMVVLADGTSTLYGAVSFNEIDKPGYLPITMGFAASMFLGGHVTRVELRDGQTPSRLLRAATPSATEFPPTLVSFGGPNDWPVPFDEGRALLVAGQLVLEVQTDLPSQPLIRLPFTTV